MIETDTRYRDIEWQKPETNSKKKKIVITSLIIMILVGASIGLYFTFRSHENTQTNSVPIKQQQQDEDESIQKSSPQKENSDNEKIRVNNFESIIENNPIDSISLEEKPLNINAVQEITLDDLISNIRQLDTFLEIINQSTESAQDILKMIAEIIINWLLANGI